MLPKVIDINHLSKDEIRELIAEIEKITLEQEQCEIPRVDRFSKDVYAREITIPKGAFIVGAIHRFENLNILSKGDVSVLSIEGSVRIQAPHTRVSPPGVKRVIYAHEESVWTTIHGTKERDLAKIEAEVIVSSYDQLKEG